MSPSSPIIWLSAGAGVLILAAVAGVSIFSESRAPGSGPLMNIAVVAPREREVLPGGVMDVGQLSEGYVHREFPPLASADVMDAYLPDEAAYDMGPPPVRSREPNSGGVPYDAVAGEAVELIAAAPQTSRVGNPLAFGFDEPRPDYVAERDARRARLDTVEADTLTRTAADAVTGSETFY